MYLSRLLAQGIKQGDRRGHCVWCGDQTDVGLPLRMSDNFTGYSWLSAGDCLCPWCYEVFDIPDFRRRSWVVSADNIMYLDRPQIIQVLLNPPDPPWYLYVKRAGKKQGWLSAVRRVNYSRLHYWLSVEWQEQPIWTSLEEVQKLYNLVSALRGNGITKTELLSGVISMKNWQRAINDGYDNLLRQARAQARKPIWEVIVYVAD